MHIEMSLWTAPSFISTRYRRFHRAHAPGPKLTSGLCYIGLAAVPSTNAVKAKVMSRLKLGSGGCAAGCVSHTFIYFWRLDTILKLIDFQKGFVK